MSLKRIAIDMDEVMADTLGEHIAWYNRDHNEEITKADLEGKWLWEIVPSDHQHMLQKYLQTEEFFANLPIIEDAQRVIEQLQTKYEVFIASAAMEVPSSFAEIKGF
jgi:5'(3')-deoxyribonucleotidase